MPGRKVIVIFAFVLLFPLISIACDLCGCYIPSGSKQSGFQVGLAEQYSSLSDLLLEGNEVDNRHDQYMNSSYTQLVVNYHLNEKATLQANVPLIYRTFRRVKEDVVETGTESGLGDVLLMGTYVPFQRKNPYSQFNWKLIGGLKFPTGNSDRIGEELEEGHEEARVAHVEESGVHGHDLALGSGSWDFVVGSAIYGQWDRWFAMGQAQYVIRTTGDFDYRYANDFLWYGGPGYYINSSMDWPIGIQALIAGEHKGEDTVTGEQTDDTAITSVYLGPAATIGIRNIATAEVGLGFPLMIDNSGLQTAPKYRVRLGLTWHF